MLGKKNQNKILVLLQLFLFASNERLTLLDDNDLSVNYKFNVPELRVGTLDSLLALSDDLVKVNNLVEAVAQKIQRQVVDLASSESEVRFVSAHT